MELKNLSLLAVFAVGMGGLLTGCDDSAPKSTVSTLENTVKSNVVQLPPGPEDFRKAVDEEMNERIAAHNAEEKKYSWLVNYCDKIKTQMLPQFEKANIDGLTAEMDYYVFNRYGEGIDTKRCNIKRNGNSLTSIYLSDEKNSDLKSEVLNSLMNSLPDKELERLKEQKPAPAI